jgi:hypothetical protein
MLTVVVRWTRLAASVAVVLALGACVLAPAAPLPAEKAAAAISADKIRKELDRVITVEFDQQPLRLAINQLHEQTRVNFVLDQVTLAQMNVDPDAVNVTLRLKDVKLRSVLRTLLSHYNLSYAVVEDTVFISSEEMAMARQLRQHVNVDLDKVEFARALSQLARETATNLVMDPRVGKEAQVPVTLQLEDVPLDTAVRLMALTIDLEAVRVGNVLFVTNKANARKMKEDPDLVPTAQPGNPEAIPGATLRPPGVVPAPPAPGAGAVPAGVPIAAPKVVDKEKTDKPAEKAEKIEKIPDKSEKD